MNAIKKMYESMGIDTEVYAYGKSILEELEERFRAVDETADYNQLKVLKARSVKPACWGPADMDITIWAGKRWKQFMRKYFTRKMLWFVRRLPAGRMLWHWL